MTVQKLIQYNSEPELSSTEFIQILTRSTLSERRPVGDVEKINGMLRNADVVVTARTTEGQLVGVSRAITDFHYCSYLSDLAVDVEFQRQGIGKRLVEATHNICGLNTNLILLAAPKARAYYSKIGMEYHDSCWIFPATT